MPKAKTKKTAKKRFKITGGGKILRRHGQLSHKRSKESVSTHRRKNRLTEVTKEDAKKIRRLLNI